MKQNYRSSLTLKDIAAATGYSVNTISRALRGKDDIANSTISKIKKTTAEMGYIRNAAASSLRSGRTNTIAVILGDVSNPLFAIIMKEIENRAREDGYSSFLFNTNEDPLMEKEAIRTALNKNVDGIIICPTQHNDSNIRYLMKTCVPFVQLGRGFDHLNAPYVVRNEELGGYQAVKHLLDNGHRDILMLNGPSYISVARERIAGYKRAYTEAGLKVKPRLIREVSIIGGNCAPLIEKLLTEKVHFTAIFAFSDLLAWDAWSYLHRQGFRVPEDFSLIGFDNVQIKLEIPYRLSTVDSYTPKVSTIAVECLLSIIRGEKQKHDTCSDICHQIIDTTLIAGETVMRVNNHITTARFKAKEKQKT